MPKLDPQTRKAEYFAKLERHFKEYSKVFVVGADNVGSNQMQQIRATLRGTATVLMGKNTMIRKALRGLKEENPDLEKLLPLVKDNMGFVFTNGDLKQVRDVILANKVDAPSRAGAIAPCDIVVPAGGTGMDPSKTSFFQALAIQTKIAKGTIEIINPISLVKEGEKVGASEAVLLNMLNISPFSYGLTVQCVYDNGTLFDASVLDLTEEDLIGRFMEGVRNVASVSLQIGYPTKCSAPHSIINGFKNVLAIAVETDIDFPQAEKAKAYLKDPSAFAVAAPAAAAGGAAAAPAAAAPVEEEESSEDEDFDLFD
eukprot:Nk52_evm54s1073 gene=Nk52_evmTU54s1073